jgi:hypothetical protein
MHKGAAVMHRRCPLADTRASLRRGTHLNEAHHAILHQFRTAARIADPPGNRAAALQDA